MAAKRATSVQPELGRDRELVVVDEGPQDRVVEARRGCGSAVDDGHLVAVLEHGVQQGPHRIGGGSARCGPARSGG